MGISVWGAEPAKEVDKAWSKGTDYANQKPTPIDYNELDIDKSEIIKNNTRSQPKIKYDKKRGESYTEISDDMWRILMALAVFGFVASIIMGLI